MQMLTTDKLQKWNSKAAAATDCRPTFGFESNTRSAIMEPPPESESSIDSFQPVQDGWQLLPVLLGRLPRSSNVYNMAIMHASFRQEMKIYTLNGDMSPDCWIVIVFEREDFGRDVNISAPPQEIQDSEGRPLQISAAIKNAFAASVIFRWDAPPYFFSALERPVADMILEISCRMNGNQTTVNPCIVYYANDSHAEGSSGHDQPELQYLNSTEGVEFIQRSFKYAKPETRVYIEKIVERAPSVGLFLPGSLEPCSGAVTTANGFIGMLYTAPEARNRGYASLVMRKLIARQLEANLSPCSIVERSNSISQAFHVSLGMKYSHDADFVFTAKNE